jgi:josephin
MTWYFEKQKLAHCAIHAVNNLLQDSIASTMLFDKIASDLESKSVSDGITPARFLWLGPAHRTPVLGYYDVNVLTEFLQSSTCACSVDWFDQRKDLNALVTDVDWNAKSFLGIILNVRRRTFLIKSTHWFCIARNRHDGSFAVLDSTNESPSPIDVNQVPAFVNGLASDNTHVLIVHQLSDAKDSL